MAEPQRSVAPRTEGGEGEGSYSHQSKLWRRMGSILEPSLKDAIVHHLSLPQLDDGPIHYADFGCSVGANTLGFAKCVVDALKSRPEIGERDIVCHFADLPSNDFNTLFKQFPPMVGQGDGGEEERIWFADGVPGTQYGRMFPRSSLHVAITAITLHYLNEVQALNPYICISTKHCIPHKLQHLHLLRNLRISLKQKKFLTSAHFK